MIKVKEIFAETIAKRKQQADDYLTPEASETTKITLGVIDRIAQEHFDLFACTEENEDIARIFWQSFKFEVDPISKNAQMTCEADQRDNMYWIMTLSGLFRDLLITLARSKEINK